MRWGQARSPNQRAARPAVAFAPAGPGRGGLPACRLRRVTDYLEAHLAEEITVARLAAEAGLSGFHFSRLFKATTGFSPSQYLMRLRLAERFAAEQARRAPDPDDAPRPEGEVRVRPSETGSILAESLARRLARGHGLSAEVHWVNEGFGIDVALRHPFEEGMVTAGVLCDLTRFTPLSGPLL